MSYPAVIDGVLVQPGAADMEYRNFLGINLKSTFDYGSYDKQQEQQIYNELVAAYPDTKDCNALKAYQTDLKAEQLKYQNLLTGDCDKGCRQVNNRHLKAIGQRLAEITEQYTNATCDTVLQNQSNDTYFSNLQKQLGMTPPSDVGTTGDILASIKNGFNSLFNKGNDNGQQGSGETDNSKKYFLFGGLALVAVVGVVLISRHNA